MVKPRLFLFNRSPKTHRRRRSWAIHQSNVSVNSFLTLSQHLIACTHSRLMDINELLCACYLTYGMTFWGKPAAEIGFRDDCIHSTIIKTSFLTIDISCPCVAGRVLNGAVLKGCHFSPNPSEEIQEVRNNSIFPLRYTHRIIRNGKGCIVTELRRLTSEQTRPGSAGELTDNRPIQIPKQQLQGNLRKHKPKLSRWASESCQNTTADVRMLSSCRSIFLVFDIFVVNFLDTQCGSFELGSVQK